LTAEDHESWRDTCFEDTEEEPLNEDSGKTVAGYSTNFADTPDSNQQSTHTASSILLGQQSRRIDTQDVTAIENHTGLRIPEGAVGRFRTRFDNDLEIKVLQKAEKRGLIEDTLVIVLESISYNHLTINMNKRESYYGHHPKVNFLENMPILFVSDWSHILRGDLLERNGGLIIGDTLDGLEVLGCVLLFCHLGHRARNGFENRVLSLEGEREETYIVRFLSIPVTPHRRKQNAEKGHPRTVP